MSNVVGLRYDIDGYEWRSGINSIDMRAWLQADAERTEAARVFKKELE